MRDDEIKESKKKKKKTNNGTRHAASNSFVRRAAKALSAFPPLHLVPLVPCSSAEATSLFDQSGRRMHLRYMAFLAVVVYRTVTAVILCRHNRDVAVSVVKTVRELRTVTWRDDYTVADKRVLQTMKQPRADHDVSALPCLPHGKHHC